MFTIGMTVGLAEWIIDDTCLVMCISFRAKLTHSFVDMHDPATEVILEAMLFNSKKSFGRPAYSVLMFHFLYYL